MKVRVGQHDQILRRDACHGVTEALEGGQNETILPAARAPVDLDGVVVIRQPSPLVVWSTQSRGGGRYRDVQFADLHVPASDRSESGDARQTSANADRAHSFNRSAGNGVPPLTYAKHIALQQSNTNRSTTETGGKDLASGGESAARGHPFSYGAHY